MAGCERAGKESRPAAAPHRRSEIASRSRFLGLDRSSTLADTGHGRTKIGSARTTTTMLKVGSIFFRTPPELVSTVLSVAYGERCLTISDRSTTRCRCRVRRLSERMMDVVDVVMLLVCSRLQSSAVVWSLWESYTRYFLRFFYLVVGEVRRKIVQVVFLFEMIGLRNLFE